MSTTVDKTIETVKGIDTSAIMDKVADWTTKMIDAATPIARQAYEIGLLTIRIDALAWIVPMILLLCLASFVFYKAYSSWKNGNKAYRAYLDDTPNHERYTRRFKQYGDFVPTEGFAHGVFGVISIIAAGVSLANLLNVWLWVKLIQPDLWLAKQAIATVLNAAGK